VEAAGPLDAVALELVAQQLLEPAICSRGRPVVARVVLRVLRCGFGAQLQANAALRWTSTPSTPEPGRSSRS